MEEEFCAFKDYESSKDFMITDILTKPPKTFKGCFSSTFTKAG